MERRLRAICPICGQKVCIGSKRLHAEAKHWSAPDDFLRKWGASNDYMKLSLEERYYKYRNERNPYRFLVDDDGSLIVKYYHKKIDAKRRDIMFILRLEDYCKLIYDAGIKVSDIGWGKSGGNKYVLGRYHDIGPYAVGNCRFITQQENINEAVRDGKWYTHYINASGPIVNPPKKERFCKICGAPIDKRAAGKTKLCQKCFVEQLHKKSMESRPDKDTLISDLKVMSMSEAARKYHVAMPTIADWCDDYNMPHYSAYFNEYKPLVDDDNKVMQKFSTRKSTVRGAGIKFTITSKEFCKLLYDSNLKSSDIGAGDDKYILWRIDESKPYEDGNCKFIKKSPKIVHAFKSHRKTYQKHEPQKCIYCGKPLTGYGKLSVCKECFYSHKLNYIKVKNKPSREELKDLIRNYPFLTIGKKYGVCDNAVRKWCKAYELPFKSFEIRKMTDEEWANI